MTQEQLYKYLRGESTDAERRKILQWINASPDNMHVYRTMRRVYDTLLCGETDLHIAATASPAPKRSSSILKHIAAAVVAIALGSAAFFSLRSLIGTGHALVETRQIDCITTPVGQRTELTLADGTHVWLSSNSRLQLPSDGSPRQVSLAGEAFFAVAKDARTPFIVNTQGRSIAVHGTRFNVNAYPGNTNMDVQLYDGAVSVTDSASIRTVTLSPGQQLTINPDGFNVTTFQQFGDDPLWIHGIHAFQNCSFAEILTQMSLVYNARLVMESTWAQNQRCTCKFHEADGLENMLESLDNIRPFSYQWDPESRILRIR